MRTAPSKISGKNMDKRSIRQAVLVRREQIPNAERIWMSEQITKKVRMQDSYRAAEDVLCFVSYGSEVVTDALMEQALREGKRVYVPRVTDAGSGRMEFVRISGLQELTEGYKGIREPASGDVYAPDCTRQALMILPGVAFDLQGHRIGYGGGFYDRYLERIHKICPMKTIAIGFQIQIVDWIEPGEYDVPYDVLITERTDIRMNYADGHRNPTIDM